MVAEKQLKKRRKLSESLFFSNPMLSIVKKILNF